MKRKSTYQGNFTTINPTGNFQGENYLLSYFGRLNYEFNKRYYATFNIRQDEYSAQILDDLNAAETNLAATNGSALLNVTRAHKNAAIALKAHVYLGMQRYADVITEANELVPASAPLKAPSGIAHELQANIKNGR